jgi:hypothetical protein
MRTRRMVVNRTCSTNMCCRVAATPTAMVVSVETGGMMTGMGRGGGRRGVVPVRVTMTMLGMAA